MTKTLFLFLFSLSLMVSGQTLTVKNDSKKDRKATIVAIPWADLVAKNGFLDTSKFSVFGPGSNSSLPFQFETQGTGKIVNLLVQMDLPPKSAIDLNIRPIKSLPVATKTFGRYVPERLDDFAWENDKIAFRAYGKALEGTKGDAYGLDVWAKRTDKPIINIRYKHGDYHHDLGDGLDYYHVGKTLGAGNIAPVLKNEIIYSNNYHRYKMLDNGPLRTSFILEYDPWKVGGSMVSCTKKISLDAGSQMNKIEVNYIFDHADTLAVVLGIIKRPEPGSITIDEKEGLMSYWEPKHSDDGTTGVGIILPSSSHKSLITEEQILAYSVVKKNMPFVYYQGAAWDKAGEIQDANQWLSYIKSFKSSLKSEPKIKIKK